MNVNRNNYEEYFLLYADNELSAEAKVEVELFIKNNPDLEEELTMLRQAVLKPDNSILIDKSMLRREESFINSGNFETRFIEYHDDELSEAEESEVLKFIGANKLQDEFALFAQAKMQPEQIPFPAKYSLYRKEEDEKVIPFRWWMAAAAILVGVGLWIGGSFVMNSNNTGIGSDFTASTPPSFSSTVAKQQPPDPQKDQQVNEHKGLQKDQQKVSPFVLVKQQPVPNSVNPNSANKNNALVKNDVRNNDLKKNDLKIVKDDKQEIVQQKPVADVPRLDPSKPITNTKDAVDPVENVTPRPESNNFARTASYVPDEEVKSENYAFFNITSEEFQKSKLGGFLKKVKRVVGRKIPFHNEKQSPEVAIN